MDFRLWGEGQQPNPLNYTNLQLQLEISNSQLYQATPVRLTVDFVSETVKATRQ